MNLSYFLAADKCQCTYSLYFFASAQGVTALVSESETIPNTNLMMRRAGLYYIIFKVVTLEILQTTVSVTSQKQLRLQIQAKI